MHPQPHPSPLLAHLDPPKYHGQSTEEMLTAVAKELSLVRNRTGSRHLEGSDAEGGGGGGGGMDPVCGSPNYFSSHGGYSMSPSMRSASFEDFDKLRWHDSRRELRAVIAVIR